MTGYDRKTLRLSHDAAAPVAMRVEVDIAGTGLWREWKTVTVAAGQPAEAQFPEAFAAYWLRVVADKDCKATATLRYE